MDNSCFLYLANIFLQIPYRKRLLPFATKRAPRQLVPIADEVSVDCFLKTCCCYSSLLLISILSPQNADTVVLLMCFES